MAKSKMTARNSLYTGQPVSQENYGPFTTVGELVDALAKMPREVPIGSAVNEGVGFYWTNVGHDEPYCPEQIILCDEIDMELEEDEGDDDFEDEEDEDEDC